MNDQSTPGKSTLERRRIERIRKLALKATDQIPDALYDEVEQLVEHGNERALATLDEDESFPELARSAIDVATTEAGYRYWVPVEIAATKKPVDLMFAPSAFLFGVLVPRHLLDKFPTSLPGTVEVVVRNKLLRQILGLKETHSTIMDDQIYRIDLKEWEAPSLVRRYLKGGAARLLGEKDRITALAKDGSRLPSTNDETADTVFVIRAICAFFAAEGKYDELEEAISPEEPERDEEKYKPLQDLIQAELTTVMGESVPVILQPEPFELWEVPEAGLMIYEAIASTIGVSDKLLASLHSVLASVPSGVSVSPIIYASAHNHTIKEATDDDLPVSEIRLAAYLSDQPGEAAILRHSWDLQDNLLSVDMVLDAVEGIGSRVGATVVFVDLLQPPRSCADCGAPLYFGPHGYAPHGHQLN